MLAKHANTSKNIFTQLVRFSHIFKHIAVILLSPPSGVPISNSLWQATSLSDRLDVQQFHINYRNHGWVYIKNDRIISAILIHLGNNGIVILELGSDHHYGIYGWS